MQARGAACASRANRAYAPLPRDSSRFIVPARFACKITICEGAAAMVAKKTAVQQSASGRSTRASGDAAKDVGGKKTSPCALFMQLSGTTWKRVSPASGWTCGNLIDSGVN